VHTHQARQIGQHPHQPEREFNHPISTVAPLVKRHEQYEASLRKNVKDHQENPGEEKARPVGLEGEKKCSGHDGHEKVGRRQGVGWQGERHFGLHYPPELNEEGHAVEEGGEDPG